MRQWCTAWCVYLLGVPRGQEIVPPSTRLTPVPHNTAQHLKSTPFHKSPKMEAFLSHPCSVLPFLPAPPPKPASLLVSKTFLAEMTPTCMSHDSPSSTSTGKTRPGWTLTTPRPRRRRSPARPSRCADAGLGWLNICSTYFEFYQRLRWKFFFLCACRLTL